MKKIGLVVVTYKDNFGSALQSFATQYVIRKLGYDTGVFDISGLSKSIRNRKIKYYLSRLIYKDERHYVFDNVSSLLKKKHGGNDFAKNMKIRHSMYQAFYKEKIHYMPSVSSWDELTNQANKVDAVLVGSDQLWGAANIAGGYFTLEFVPDKIKKIAYSTSFGVSTIPKQLHERTRRFISRINCVSVRETSGKDIIKNIVNRNVPVVCDPTMLLTDTEWMSIQEEESFFSGDYILTYFMGDNSEHREFVNRLKKQTGYKIVGLLHGSTYIADDENYCDFTPYNVGPGEFLNLIRNAKFICTDSFHCCVFSIIYNKLFFVFRRDKENRTFSTNDRIHTLLGWSGLNERLLDGSEDINMAINMTIDYKCVMAKLDEYRKDSFEYLKKSLGDV